MEILWIVIGIVSALIIGVIIYSIQAYSKMYVSKNKIKNVYFQIKGQVNIKHGLLKEYVEINKEDIEENIYNDICEKLAQYNKEELNVESLKDHNYAYTYYMKNFNDNLLFKQCDVADEKINHIKGYYNELVCFFNRYKGSKINSFLAKVLFVKDEKLY